MRAILLSAWRSEARGPVLVFLALIAVKLAFVAPSVSGPIIADEGFYISYARQLLFSGGYNGAHYPPLYPLLLTPAMLHWPGFWNVLEVLNTVYSASMVIFVYLIARELTDRRFALGATVVSAVIPFHFTLSGSVMSENVFIPLLLAAVWAVVRVPPVRRTRWDLVTGLLLGSLVMTRYVGLVAVPVLLLVWWLQEASDGGRRRATRALVVLVGIALPVLAWLVAKVGFDGLPLSAALGFGIADDPEQAQLTAERLVLFAGAYAAYFALVAAPYLGLLVTDIAHAWRTRAKDASTRFTIAWVGLTATFGVALVRHSWRAFYNYPDPLRIMGRYAIPFSLLFLIAAFAGLYRLSRRDGGLSARSALVLAALHAIVVGAAAWLLFEVLPAGFITDRGAVDVFRLQLVGWPSLVAAVCIGAGATYALVRGVGTRMLLAVFTSALVLWSVWGIPAYAERLAGHQRYAEHARQLALYGRQRPGVPIAAFLDAAVVDELGVAEGTRWPGVMHVGSWVWATRWVDAEPADWQGPLEEGTQELGIFIEEEPHPEALISYEIDGISYVAVLGRP